MSDRDCICDSFSPVTEAAALAAAEWVGRGDGTAAGLVAREAMAAALAARSFSAQVIAGRASTEDSDGLRVGDVTGVLAGQEGGEEETWELAVKALEGHEALAKGLDGAFSMIAAGPKGSLLSLPEMYMQKIVVCGRARDAIDMDAPVAQNVRSVAATLKRPVEDLTVVVLDRPRHEDLIQEITQSGARVKLIEDGDVSAGIAAAVEDSGVDLFIGVGGSTEGIITAAAMRCLGGEMQARLWPVSRYQVEAVRARGIEDLEARLKSKDMVGEGVLVAVTAVTRGRFLRGVEKRAYDMRTETMVMCSRCGKIKLVRTIHRDPDVDAPVELWVL